MKSGILFALTFHFGIAKLRTNTWAFQVKLLSSWCLVEASVLIRSISLFQKSCESCWRNSKSYIYLVTRIGNLSRINIAPYLQKSRREASLRFGTRPRHLPHREAAARYGVEPAPTMAAMRTNAFSRISSAAA